MNFLPATERGIRGAYTTARRDAEIADTAGLDQIIFAPARVLSAEVLAVDPIVWIGIPRETDPVYVLEWTLVKHF